MKFKLIESIKKQPDVEYKGFTIEHFPYTWHFVDDDKESFDVDGYVIHSPYYIGTDDNRYYMPLYCEDEDGEDLNFDTLDAAKNYIDTYLVTKKGKIKIKHGDEVHYELNVDDSMGESYEDLEYICRYCLNKKEKELKKKIPIKYSCSDRTCYVCGRKDDDVVAVLYKDLKRG